MAYFRNYNRKSYNNSYYNGPKYKKSGYEWKLNEDGFPICWGWRKTRYGIMRMYARPYKKSNIHESKAGNEFVNLFVTITTENGQITKTSGLFNMTTKKLVIKDLGLVGSPNGGGQTRKGKFSKGYFGKFR